MYLQAFDRLLQRNEKLHAAIRDKIEQEEEPIADITVTDIPVPDIGQIKSEHDIKKEPEETIPGEVKTEPADDAAMDSSVKEEQTEIKTEPGKCI